MVNRDDKKNSNWTVFGNQKKKKYPINQYRYPEWIWQMTQTLIFNPFTDSAMLALPCWRSGYHRNHSHFFQIKLKPSKCKKCPRIQHFHSMNNRKLQAGPVGHGLSS